MPTLAERFTVIAPDLLGHGESAKPRGDYSLGAYASGIRDLMAALGHERATFVGHSLGGGVAMQLAYQFPERCERLVLVDSGGLGRRGQPAAAHGDAAGRRSSCCRCSRAAGARRRPRGRPLLGRLGLRPHTDIAEILAATRRWRPRRARGVRPHAAGRSSTRGQRVSANDRLYLAEEVPFLIIWGQRDRIIPVAHAHAVQRGCRPAAWRSSGSGPLPARRRAAALHRVLMDFIDTTKPAEGRRPGAGGSCCAAAPRTRLGPAAHGDRSTAERAWPSEMTRAPSRWPRSSEPSSGG